MKSKSKFEKAREIHKEREAISLEQANLKNYMFANEAQRLLRGGSNASIIDNGFVYPGRLVDALHGSYRAGVINGMQAEEQRVAAKRKGKAKR